MLKRNICPDLNFPSVHYQTCINFYKIKNTTLFHADNSVTKSKTSCNAVGFEKLLRIGDEQSTVNTMFGSDDVAFTFHPCKKRTKITSLVFHFNSSKLNSFSDTAAKLNKPVQVLKPKEGSRISN